MTGAELQALRKAMGLTQTELGARMGLSLRAIQDIEAKPTEQARKLHELAIERIALTIAVERGDSALAPETIRAEAAALAKVEGLEPSASGFGDRRSTN